MEASEFLTLAEAAQEAGYSSTSTSSLQCAADQSGHARAIGLQRSVTSVTSVIPRVKQGVWVTLQGAWVTLRVMGGWRLMTLPQEPSYSGG
jgi:hypothetical protein